MDAILYMLVFNSEHLRGGVVYGLETVAVYARSQVPFKPTRLVVPPEIGRDFSLGDLKIENRSFFASHAGAGVSMSVFPPAVKDTSYQIDNLRGIPVVEPGETVVLMVTNRCLHALQFSCLMYGESPPCDIRMELAGPPQTVSDMEVSLQEIVTRWLPTGPPGSAIPSPPINGVSGATGPTGSARLSPPTSEATGYILEPKKEPG